MAALVIFGLLGVSTQGCATTSESDAESSTGAAEKQDTLVGDVTADAITPAYWNVDADPTSPTPGSEPINVIISTNLPLEKDTNNQNSILSELRMARTMPAWQAVDVGAGIKFVTGLVKAQRQCISAESADIDGDAKGVSNDGCVPANASACVGNDVQEVSWRTTPDPTRVFTCTLGALLEGESHARAWKSNKQRVVTRSGEGLTTWYLALSQEHVCQVEKDGKKTPWHCILPNGYHGTTNLTTTGKKIDAETGGYNKGRDDFIADLKRIASVHNYEIICQDFARPEGSGLRVPNTAPVTWDGKVTHCSVVDGSKLKAK